MEVVLREVQFHPDRSTPTALTAATSGALTECLQKGNPVLLEPLMEVLVETPDEFTGEVLGSITHRRGSIVGVKRSGGVESISASVPLREMFGYTTVLRSLTQGRGTFTMQLSRYRPVEEG